MTGLCVAEWSHHDTAVFLTKEGFCKETTHLLCDNHQMDGKCLLSLVDADFTIAPLSQLKLRERKLLRLIVRNIQRENHSSLIELGISDLPSSGLYSHLCPTQKSDVSEYCESERITPPMSEDGRASRLPPEIGKAFISFCYVVAVTWVTALTMVIVHDRVPDMKKYPPLPDIFLDNIPHISWAFNMCEITGTIMFTIWLAVLLFHKHRFILLRRFFALSGTVFFLRCVTMLITSLSVPGSHLECRPRDYKSGMTPLYNYLYHKFSEAYIIWRAAGMSIRGVRTCGDYMFSGHTVALTMLNFFITEYTPHRMYFLHTLAWVMNMFGIFFILAAHEHYSIDVFVAFYITSRLFLYYHTLANNQILVHRDSNRTRIWFPMFSFFESSVDGIVPNEYDTIEDILGAIWRTVKNAVITIHQTLNGRLLVKNTTVIITKKKK